MPRRSLWAGLPTEALHPEALDLDEMPARSVLRLMAREDERVVRAVRAESSSIERAARRMTRVLASGGRVFFAGAGTSGRLGVLEAAECPPTFGTDPDRIVALIAGGSRAVFRSVEGAEDREKEGAKLLRDRKLGASDLVVGISASSVTPFVRGALAFARRRKASTVLVTCGPRPRGLAGVVVAPKVGPEVLAGSTRLKAGTATKLVLNQMTLLAMIRSKKVFGPFMVDVRPKSKKLLDRATRIVQSLGKVGLVKGEALLGRSRGDVKVAVVMARLGVSLAEARRSLARTDGDLRKVLRAAGAGRGRDARRPARARRRGAGRAPRGRPS
jgi:N-acetylmuramic acid 6-phosphate etherase